MKTQIKNFVLAGLALAVSSPAFAGGPIAQCAPGQAFVWGSGGANIPFNPDMGDLVVPGDHAASVQLVVDAFQVWEDVSTATATYVNAGELPEDVTGANVLTYWAEPAPDGLSPVIFDFDGSAGATLGFPAGVLGVAGIAWVNTITCEAFEGVALLIGPTFGGAPVAAFDVTVHEFGHYSGLGHTVVNGQIYLGSVGGDNSGPTPNDTFTPIPNPFTEVVETMYPFYYGPPIGTASLHKDDESAISELYPEPAFATDFATISGAALIGTTPVTGANVIARNVADPFNDAVSAISGDFSVGGDAFVGQWDVEGLTPDADYAVYVDEILAGGFSTPVLSPLPGPEEFWNGAGESSDPNSDDPSVFEAVSAGAGGTASGIDIVFNQPGEGDPLPVGDDGSVQLALPFAYEICGQEFGSVFVNANGSLTFGAGDADFSESAQEMLDGPPRIAGAWDDLQPVDPSGAPQGQVFFTTTNNTFTVTWDNVPEWGFPTGIGSNNFSIELKKGASQATVDYGNLDMVDGLAGVSCGLFQTGGIEPESVLRQGPNQTTHNYNGDTAIYENFDGGDNDLANYSLKYNTTKHELADVFENNNSQGTAAAITTPFNTAPNSMFTEISPAAADIDFFSFEATAGQYIIAEVTRGQIDSVLGLFNSSGVLIAANDDSNGLLSRLEGTLPADDTYTLAVTFCCDFDFDGVDAGQGLPFDEGRYVLDVQVLDGLPLALGDDTSVNLSGFGFSFPYDGGSYSDVFINSNGNITFGGPDFDFSESIGEFENGSPRVAALWDDLDATGALVLANTDFATELSIEFVDVPEFGGVGANNFTVTLFSNGDVEIDYGSMTAADGIVGAAEGGGQGSTATDLSTAGGGDISDSPVEQFDGGNPNDLSGDNVTFVP